MKNKSNVYWLVSALFLGIAALWGAAEKLSGFMDLGTICGISLIVFGVISLVAAFNYGIRSTSGGWILTEGLLSFLIGLSYIFTSVDYSLFTLDLVYIMGLWLMFLGISQLIRTNKKSMTFGRVLALITSVMAIVGGLSLYVKPLAELFRFSRGGVLQVYSITFQFLIAALLVLSRLANKDSKR